MCNECWERFFLPQQPGHMLTHHTHHVWIHTLKMHTGLSPKWSAGRLLCYTPSLRFCLRCASTSLQLHSSQPVAGGQLISMAGSAFLPMLSIEKCSLLLRNNNDELTWTVLEHRQIPLLHSEGVVQCEIEYVQHHMPGSSQLYNNPTRCRYRYSISIENFHSLFHARSSAVP